MSSTASRRTKMKICLPSRSARRFARGVALSLTLFAPTASFARTDPTPVIHGDAQVRIGDGADFTVAQDGAPVASGTTVRAQASSAARIDVADGVSLRLAPGAVVTVRNFSWLPAEHPGAQAVRALQINLMGGEVDLTSHSKDPSGDLGMTILLPEGRSFALWRGDANVRIEGDNADAALYEGMAIAGAGTKWKPLPGGKGVVIPMKGDPALRPIPGTPAWADGQSNVAPFAVVRGNGGGVVGAAWGDTPGAASYRVEIAHDATMSGPITVTSTTTRARRLPGRHREPAVDPEGPARGSAHAPEGRYRGFRRHRRALRDVRGQPRRPARHRGRDRREPRRPRQRPLLDAGLQ
jgi:hypothetical protein